MSTNEAHRLAVEVLRLQHDRDEAYFALVDECAKVYPNLRATDAASRLLRALSEADKTMTEHAEKESA